MLQTASSSTPFPEIQLPVRSELLRNILRAMAVNLSRASRPAVLVVPQNDRHELRSSVQFIAQAMDLDIEPRFALNDREFAEYVFGETHLTRPVVHLNGDHISPKLQQQILRFWNKSKTLPPLTIIVVSRDPGELYEEKQWLPSFRGSLHMPTFRWPEAATRLKTSDRRVTFFTKVFEEIAQKQLPESAGEGGLIEPGARDYLHLTFFTEHKPKYVGNYVKLAVDLIATMKKFNEPRLTTKVVRALTAPGQEFSLG